MRRAIFAIALLLAALEIAAVGGWTSAPHEAITTLVRGQAPFLTSALAGVFVLYRASGPSAGAWRRTLAVGVFCECAQLLLRLRAGQPASALLQSIGVGIGAAAACALYFDARRAHPGSRPPRDASLAAVVLVAFVILSSSLVDLTRVLYPTTLDAFTYRADAGYGFPVSFAVGSLFEQVKALQLPSQIAYVELPLVCALVSADELSSPDPPRHRALTLIVALGIAGSALYHLFPVAGPAYAFEGRFPFLPPSPAHVPLAPMLVTAKVARNCMPSLHAAWTLSLVWTTRRAPRHLRVVTWLCFAWTIAATLGFGYHYLIDLVVAVPFLSAIRALCAGNAPHTRRARARAIAISGSLLAGWLLAIRYGAEWFASHVSLTWGLTVASTVLAFAVDLRLFSTEARRSAPLRHTLGPTAERMP